MLVIKKLREIKGEIKIFSLISELKLKLKLRIIRVKLGLDTLLYW